MRKNLQYTRGSALLEAIFALVIIAMGVLAGFRAIGASIEQHTDNMNFAKAGMGAIALVNLMESLVDGTTLLGDNVPSLADFSTGNYVAGSCNMASATRNKGNDRQRIFFNYLESLVEGFAAIKGTDYTKIAVDTDRATHGARVRICWNENNSKLSKIAGLVGSFEFSTRINVLNAPVISF